MPVSKPIRTPRLAFLTIFTAALLGMTAIGATLPALPRYVTGPLGAGSVAVGVVIGAFSATALVGRPFGGRLADRVGRRPIVIGTLAAATPLVLLFLVLPAGVATPLLFLAGAVVVASFSVTVVLGQEYLPNRIGVASGVTLGLAIGLGGLGAPLLGLLADAHGLETTLLVAALLPLLGVAAALTLPRDRRAAAMAA